MWKFKGPKIVKQFGKSITKWEDLYNLKIYYKYNNQYNVILP